MPNNPTIKPPEKMLVKPGEGRKIPLPIPGTNVKVPAEGMSVVKTMAVIRLLRVGDLVPVQAAAPATSKQASKEG